MTLDDQNNPSNIPTAEVEEGLTARSSDEALALELDTQQDWGAELKPATNHQAESSGDQAKGIRAEFDRSGDHESVVKSGHGLFENFDALNSTDEVKPEMTIDRLMDIPVQVSVEIGRTNLPIKNVLQLAQGSVIELDGAAGEPMTVLVNGKMIARGEVVVVNDKFGIRLTDIVEPAQRIPSARK